MERGLVVLDPTDEHRELLAEAGEHARGGDAELVLLTMMTDEEYESDVEVLDSIGSMEDFHYDSDAVLDAAANEVGELAADVLPEGVSYRTLARATDESRADVVLETATQHDCDHVYVLGRRRSPTGKAIFGDVAQRIALDFEGFVTLATN